MAARPGPPRQAGTLEPSHAAIPPCYVLQSSVTRTRHCFDRGSVRLHSHMGRCVAAKRRSRICPQAVRQPVTDWPRFLHNESISRSVAFRWGLKVWGAPSFNYNERPFSIPKGASSSEDCQIGVSHKKNEDRRPLDRRMHLGDRSQPIEMPQCRDRNAARRGGSEC